MPQRLDKLLAKRLGSRTKAQDAIDQKRVVVNGQTALKSSMKIDEEDNIEILPAQYDFVSRSGAKLEGVLEEFDVDLKDEVVLDIGASTGGFTQCALQRNARKVYALDVGHLQLADALKKDPRVVEMEGINARNIKADWFDEPVDFVCMDVSFISCKTILDPLLERMKPKHMAVLIKPQFECGPEHLNGSGIVKDARVVNSVLDDMKSFLRASYKFVRIVPCVIKGRQGNQEYMAYCDQKIDAPVQNA